MSLPRPAQYPCCGRGHRLKQDRRLNNVCDLCDTQGTEYRCSQGCDYDTCQRCYAALVQNAQNSNPTQPAANGKSESFIESDAAFARSIATQEDAEVARHMAMADAAGNWPQVPFARGSGPRLSSQQYTGNLGRQPGPSFMPPEDRGLIYVACEIGDVAVEMMVDTGAQTSVISEPLVRRLNLASRIDSSQQGVAAGVGRARILGKLRKVPVKLGHVEFALDLSVLGHEENLLLLGIDQMRRFKCIVDIPGKSLRFGGSDGIEVPFLPPAPHRVMPQCPTM